MKYRFKVDMEIKNVFVLMFKWVALSVMLILFSLVLLGGLRFLGICVQFITIFTTIGMLFEMLKDVIEATTIFSEVNNYKEEKIQEERI
jgi:hypothetical protein